MKLIWAPLKNRGQNSIFKPNRAKPCVHQSTGDRVVQHHRLTGGVQSGRPDRSTDQAYAIRSTGCHVIRSTRQVDRWNQPGEKNLPKPVCKPVNPAKLKYLKGKPLDPGSKY
ncbi:hypothetical protein L484_010149 [Morus notabilis]|uniref:Uncharacterized protein n=1 Tax=Morus notabilis TaxID=981085 RepID=W9RHI5_9ROSA|nr:hypothetical protein L484_010149 [Morus notabilis]